MKKIRIYLASALLTIAGSAMAQKVVIEDVTVAADATTADVVISLQDNTTEVAAWNAKLTLPEGVTFTKKKVVFGEDLYPYDAENEDFYHALTLSKTDNVSTFIVYATPTMALKSNNGVLATITVTIPETFTGSAEGSFTEIHISDSKAVDTAVGDVTFKINRDEATAIKSITAAQLKNGEVYNLHGQKVNAANKGVYVVNGKKVVVK